MHRARRPHGLVSLLKLVLLAISAVLVVRILVAADLGRVHKLLTARGPLLLVALVPYFAAISIDTFGWRVILGGLARSPSLLRLLWIRLSTEAVLLSAPLGAPMAESLKAYLLERRLGVPVSEGVASIAVKKGLLTIALALFLSTSVVVGHEQLAAVSDALIGGAGLPWVVAAAAVALAFAGALLSVSLRHGALSGRLHRLLMAIPFARLRDWLLRREPGFTAVDAHFAPLAASRGRLLAAAATFYVGFLVETLESFLLLRLVGADIGLVQLISLEASVSLIRSLAVFVPAGIGFQDAGYLAFFTAFGVPDATQVGTAFVLLKRAKELFWIVVGYLLLVASRDRRRVDGAPTAPPTPPHPPARARVLFICGTVHQTRQMHQIRDALGEAFDCRFSPYIVEGYLLLLRWLRLLEVSIGGHKLRRRCLDYLTRHGLPVDLDGGDRRYDLVVTASDIVMPRWTRELAVVVVQEGMTDPENLLYHLYRRFPRLVPRWLPGTSTTGMSGQYDKLCVASPGYKQFFVEKKGIPAEKLEVTGIPNFDDCARYLAGSFAHRGYVLVCTSDGRETFRFEDRQAFLARAVRIAAGRPMIFKLHPNEKLERASREIARVAPDSLVMIGGSAEEMVAHCDVLVCQYSTLAYVGLALRKEVHSFFDVGELERLLPLQNRCAAQLIAGVCQRVLDDARRQHGEAHRRAGARRIDAPARKDPAAARRPTDARAATRAHPRGAGVLRPRRRDHHAAR